MATITQSGNAVREAINQGFTRAEIASLSDKEAIRVYQGASATGTVVENKFTNAIENYKAAVACFVRALPSLPDDGSAELVRNEIRRLLARLGELNGILRQVKGEPVADEDDSRMTNRLLHELNFEMGDEVEVDETRPGKIISCDYETGTYGIEYDDDGSTENGVVGSRVRARTAISRKPTSSMNPNSLFGSAEEEERFRLWSELVESERVYRDLLKRLVDHYLIPLDSPMQWIGEKDRKSTMFSQKTLTAQERKILWGNIEDIAGTSQLVFESLEKRFLKWSYDQKLAGSLVKNIKWNATNSKVFTKKKDVFLEYANLYEQYEIFADAYYSSEGLLKQMKKERSAFEAIEMRARQLGTLPLDELLKLPLERPAHCKALLSSLARRTNQAHPDYESIRQAYVMFGKVEEQISLALNRVQMEAKVAEIENKFTPPIKVAKKNRYIVRFEPSAIRIEGSSTNQRYVWLFNDMILFARNSELNKWGFDKIGLRHCGQFFVSKARSAPEYGPNAVEIAGTAEKAIIVARDEQDKNDWLKALRAFLPANASNTRKSVSKSKTTVVQPPPPPPQSQVSAVASTMTVNPENKLGMATIKQIELRKQKSGEFTITWKRAQAKYKFDGAEVGDLPFVKGEVLEVAEENPPGWAKARRLANPSDTGIVPLNYLEFL